MAHRAQCIGHSRPMARPSPYTSAGVAHTAARCLGARCAAACAFGGVTSIRAATMPTSAMIASTIAPTMRSASWQSQLHTCVPFVHTVITQLGDTPDGLDALRAQAG